MYNYFVQFETFVILYYCIYTFPGNKLQISQGFTTSIINTNMCSSNDDTRISSRNEIPPNISQSRITLVLVLDNYQKLNAQLLTISADRAKFTQIHSYKSDLPTIQSNLPTIQLNYL